MLGYDVDVEQDYQEAATKISKKSLKRYKIKLFAVDNDDDHGERDRRFHDINEEQDDVEFDDIEDIDMNEAYEEQDSFKDDGEKDMEDLEKVTDLENPNDELVEEECEVPENEEEHEVSQQENEAVFLMYTCTW
ncbi:hypothetical protein Hanom_Chr04g00362841 [Helianthus anomalus]